MKAGLLLLVMALGWSTALAQPAAPVAPTAKEIIRHLLASHAVHLQVDPSCKGVGSDFKDTTIGDYVSGLLAAQTADGGKNWVETSAKLRQASVKGGGLLWNCSIVFRRQHGEEEWGWGVTFVVRDTDRKVVRESFRCTGGG